ncbi:Integral membrane protein CcmA involved in cell shape determination [Methylacidiphilum infernorum V4]|uniref:Integral membrane protein CcmA involved in cell shape determination n=2 Tax=Candidatus Methylacidiphilum infernorum TaxID=511746 RepID=B3DUR2_METI4|nr:Integral membrane protein CcmA involved in cell shape determination [Methylacidiphilum infernorum V4]
MGTPPPPPPPTPSMEKALFEKEEDKQKEKPILTQKTALLNEQKKDSQAEQPADKQGNILAYETRLSGLLAFQKQLVLNGVFEGEIYSKEGTLIIGQKAVVRAKVEVDNILIYGQFSGNICVSNLTELKVGSEVVGDVKTKKLRVEEGATLVGKCECIARP